MRIDLRVKYLCGCEENVRLDVNLPPNLANAPRSEENDRSIIRYITDNYRVENWSCSHRHPSGTMRGFNRIIEILN